MHLDQTSAQKLLRKHSIPFPKTVIGLDYSKISKLKYPVVIKVDSQKVLHKSDLGLVITNLYNLTQVKSAAAKIRKILMKKRISEFELIIQEQIKGREFIIGVKKDLNFGPIVVFGVGGFYVEAFNDVSMRIAPFSAKDAKEMLLELKSQKYLHDYRNTKINMEKLINILLKVSKMCAKEQGIVEMDFNPVIVNKHKAYVVDARIIKNV